MAESTVHSSGSSTSSPKYDFSDSDSDHKRPRSSRPRRVPTSNNKNAIAARRNRIKQKQYVKSLEQIMSVLKHKISDLKKELCEREKKWARSCREIAYLRAMLANSPQIGNLLRNVRWRNIIPQGSNVDKTLNELNSEMSIDSFPITSSHSLFDGCFDLLEEEENPLPPPVIPADHEEFPTDHIIDLTGAKVGVCLHVSNKKISVEFCDECSARFYDNPFI